MSVASGNDILVNDVTSNTVITTPKKRIVIGLPGTTFSNNFLICWTQTLAYLWQTGLYEIIVSPGQSSYVSFARAKTLGCDVRRGKNQKPFAGEHFDLFVSLDSDMVWSPTHFETLITEVLKYKVLSGYYMMQDGQHVAVVKDWDTEYFKKNASFEFLKVDDFKELKEPMQVSYAGLGFFAATKEVFDKLQYPYFHEDLQTIGDDMVDECSEDVAFCKKIVRAGYKIHVHPQLRVGHEKNVIL